MTRECGGAYLAQPQISSHSPNHGCAIRNLFSCSRKISAHVLFRHGSSRFIPFHPSLNEQSIDVKFAVHCALRSGQCNPYHISFWFADLPCTSAFLQEIWVIWTTEYASSSCPLNEFCSIFCSIAYRTVNCLPVNAISSYSPTTWSQKDARLSDECIFEHSSDFSSNSSSRRPSFGFLCFFINEVQHLSIDQISAYASQKSCNSAITDLLAPHINDINFSHKDIQGSMSGQYLKFMILPPSKSPRVSFSINRDVRATPLCYSDWCVAGERTPKEAIRRTGSISLRLVNIAIRGSI